MKDEEMVKKRHSIICASYLFLLKDEKILLSRRFNTGYEDGNYSVPAGHVDEGETVFDALLRETKEEIGIDIKKTNAELTHVMHRSNTDSNDERLDFFFVCKKWNGEIKNAEPHKCDDLSWFDVNSLPDNVLPYIKKSIESSSSKNIFSEFGW